MYELKAAPYRGRPTPSRELQGGRDGVSRTAESLASVRAAVPGRCCVSSVDGWWVDNGRAEKQLAGS